MFTGTINLIAIGLRSDAINSVNIRDYLKVSDLLPKFSNSSSNNKNTTLPAQAGNHNFVGGHGFRITGQPGDEVKVTWTTTFYDYDPGVHETDYNNECWRMNISFSWKDKKYSFNNVFFRNETYFHWGHGEFDVWAYCDINSNSVSKRILDEKPGKVGQSGSFSVSIPQGKEQIDIVFLGDETGAG